MSNAFQIWSNVASGDLKMWILDGLFALSRPPVNCNRNHHKRDIFSANAIKTNHLYNSPPLFSFSQTTRERHKHLDEDPGKNIKSSCQISLPTSSWPPAHRFRSMGASPHPGVLKRFAGESRLRKVEIQEKRLRSSFKSRELHHHTLCGSSIAGKVFWSRMICFLLVFKDGKGWKKYWACVWCWAWLGAEHHFLCFAIANFYCARDALLNLVAGKILAQNYWNMFPQKIAALWKEVSALGRFEEPTEVLVEVVDNKFSKVFKRIERLMEKVFLELVTGKDFPERIK